MRTLTLLAAMYLPTECMASIIRDGDTVYVNGVIDEVAAQLLNAEFDNGARKLVIQSKGGDAAAALSVAENMLKYDVDIVVDKYCMSACANYLFLAGRQKSLQAGALLGYHGGLVGADAAFYAAIGVDVDSIANNYNPATILKGLRPVDMTVNGQKYTHVFRDDASQAKFLMEIATEDDLADHRYVFDEWSNKPISSTATYFPSKATLAAHGVAGIVDYPYPRSQKDMDKLGKSISAGLKLFGDYKTR
jgi:hypothetical protein